MISTSSLSEFNKQQFEHIYPPGIQNHYWNYARNIILSKIISSKFSGSKIIEIGCGSGVVVDYLRSRGLDCWGIEPSATDAASSSVEKYIYFGKSFEGLTEDVRQQFKVVILLDVIEHIEKPVLFLRNVVSAFPNATDILITVPARRELWSNYDVFNGHYLRYDIDSLSSLVSTTSFLTHRSIGYFFHLLYFPAKLLLSFGQRDTKIVPPRGFILRLFHRIVSYFFVADYILFPASVWGTSLYCIVSIDRSSVLERVQ